MYRNRYVVMTWRFLLCLKSPNSLYRVSIYLCVLYAEIKRQKSKNPPFLATTIQKFRPFFFLPVFKSPEPRLYSW